MCERRHSFRRIIGDREQEGNTRDEKRVERCFQRVQVIIKRYGYLLFTEIDRWEVIMNKHGTGRELGGVRSVLVGSIKYLVLQRQPNVEVTCGPKYWSDIIVSPRFKVKYLMKISLKDKKNLPNSNPNPNPTHHPSTPPDILKPGLPSSTHNENPENHPNTSNKLILQTLQDNEEPMFERRSALSYPLLPDLKKRVLTGKMRALLYDWLILVASQHMFTRDTFSLAMCYMDLYIWKKELIQKDHLQAIGFACMTIAAKMEESKMPCTVPTLFEDGDINLFELDICNTLNFNLNPDTHIYWANLMMTSWDDYVQENLQECSMCRYFSSSQFSFTLNREVYDILDSVTLHIDSVIFERDDLVANLLFVTTRKNVEGKAYGPKLEGFLQKFYCNDGFTLKFVQFMRVMGLKKFKANKKVGSFVFRFLGLRINYRSPQIETSSWSQFVSIQTHNKEMHSFVRQILDQ